MAPILNQLGSDTISQKENQEETNSEQPACLDCGHQFTTGELAAMTASAESCDLCVIDCSACGTHNIARAEPRGGFNRQPRLVVLRTAEHKPEAPDVFHETVEPGVDVHPVTRGKSD